MSDAFSGVGTTFKRWNSSTGQWDRIAEITNIGGPTMTRDTIDVTSMDSTGGYKEFIASFRDAGTVSLDMNFTRNGYETMLTDFESDDLQNYEIGLPDADNTTFEFQGLVTECPLSAKADDKVGSSVTIKISGAVAVNSGSGPSPG